jgi:hypothetical protein
MTDVHWRPRVWSFGGPSADGELFGAQAPLRRGKQQARQVSFARTVRRNDKDGLPLMEGWLLKANPSALGFQWQWRWFVLREKKISWYASREDAKQGRNVRGVLAFELVRVGLRVLWEELRTEAAAAGGSGVSGGGGGGGDSGGGSGGGNTRGLSKSEEDAPTVKASNPDGCVDNPAQDRPDTNEFRLSLEGFRKVFALRTKTRRDALQWAQALRTHLDAAEEVAAAGAADTVVSSKLQWKFWRFDRISPSKLEAIARTGDLLLFQTPRPMERLIRGFTQVVPHRCRTARLYHPVHSRSRTPAASPRPHGPSHRCDGITSPSSFAWCPRMPRRRWPTRPRESWRCSRRPAPPGCRSYPGSSL